MDLSRPTTVQLHLFLYYLVYYISFLPFDSFIIHIWQNTLVYRNLRVKMNMTLLGDRVIDNKVSPTTIYYIDCTEYCTG